MIGVTEGYFAVPEVKRDVEDVMYKLQEEGKWKIVKRENVQSWKALICFVIEVL